jgi:hypothetical protein
MFGLGAWIVALTSAASGVPVSSSVPHATRPVLVGPWGEIHSRRLFIEAPERLITQQMMPSTDLQWVVSSADLAQMALKLEELGLKSSVCDELLDPAHRTLVDGQVILHPTSAVLAALTEDQRSRIYEWLALNPANVFMANPIIFSKGSPEPWLSHAVVSDEVKGVVRKHLWRIGQSLRFSDVELILELATDEPMRMTLTRLCTRTEALIVEIRPPAYTDREKIALFRQWWGVDQVTSPISEATCEENSIEEPLRIDVSYLLPSLPRRLINTYGSAAFVRDGRHPQCHWSALNFFNDPPDLNLLDLRTAAQFLMSHYDRVPEPWQFGDILCVLDAQGDALHSCVYLGGDIVFTKNGDNDLIPWVLAPLSDIQNLYRPLGEGSVQAFRKRK